jgi:AcrR family transcriptional regulator
MTGPDQAGQRRSRTRSGDVARELLYAAEYVLVKDGLTGLTVRAVAAAAGVAPMSVYNQFGSKSGLLAALLRQGFDRLGAALDADAEPDALTRLRRCGLRYREFALANPQLYAVLFGEPASEVRSRGEVQERAVACFGVLARNVELATAAGALAAADARETAQQIWSGLHGAVALELKGLVQTPDPAATYQAFLDTVLRGLRPPVRQGRTGPTQPREPDAAAIREASPGRMRS